MLAALSLERVVGPWANFHLVSPRDDCCRLYEVATGMRVT